MELSLDEDYDVLKAWFDNICLISRIPTSYKFLSQQPKGISGKVAWLWQIATAMHPSANSMGRLELGFSKP